MITDLMDIKRADIWQFAHHESITPYLKGLFYMNYQTSSSQNNSNRFTSCDVISFKELVTRLPNKNGIEFVLNPCYKYHAYSRIPLTCDAVTNDPDKTRLQISPEALSFKFDTLLLKPVNTSIKQTEAFFKGYIDYTKTEMVLNKSAYINFVPSKITATKAILTLSDFTPIINTISTGIYYLQEDLALKNNVLKKASNTYYYTGFYGIVNGKGFIKSSIDTNISIAVSSVLINKNAITGLIELSVEKNSNSKYLFTNVLLTEPEILEKLKVLLNASVQLASKKEGDVLRIAFLIKH